MPWSENEGKWDWKITTNTSTPSSPITKEMLEELMKASEAEMRSAGGAGPYVQVTAVGGGGGGGSGAPAIRQVVQQQEERKRLNELKIEKRIAKRAEAINAALERRKNSR